MSTSTMYLSSHPPTKPKPTAARIASTLSEHLAGDPSVSTAGDIGGSLRELLRAISVRNAATRQSVADANRVGLTVGRCDPLSRVQAGREPVAPMTRLRDYIDIDGMRFTEASPTDEVLAVISAAIESAGVNLRCVRTGKPVKA